MLRHIKMMRAFVAAQNAKWLALEAGADRGGGGPAEAEDPRVDVCLFCLPPHRCARRLRALAWLRACCSIVGACWRRLPNTQQQPLARCCRNARTPPKTYNTPNAHPKQHSNHKFKPKFKLPQPAHRRPALHARAGQGRPHHPRGDEGRHDDDPRGAGVQAGGEGAGWLGLGGHPIGVCEGSGIWVVLGAPLLTPTNTHARKHVHAPHPCTHKRKHKHKHVCTHTRQ